MNERTTRKSVTFLHPFSLAGIDEILEAGTYIVETLEELIEKARRDKRGKWLAFCVG